MPVIREDVTPELFNIVQDRNLQQQYYLLETMVTLALGINKFKLTPEIVYELNRTAVQFLTFKPGQYRDQHAYIEGSEHAPPDWSAVPALMKELFDYLNQNWERRTASHLAAFVLWRLNWVHPFEEGNGRTARAVAYFVVCLKHKMWLPGRRTIGGQIEDDHPPYYEALRAADAKHRDDGTIDVSVMEQYIERLLKVQLTP